MPSSSVLRRIAQLITDGDWRTGTGIISGRAPDEDVRMVIRLVRVVFDGSDEIRDAFSAIFFSKRWNSRYRRLSSGNPRIMPNEINRVEAFALFVQQTSASSKLNSDAQLK